MRGKPKKGKRAMRRQRRRKRARFEEGPRFPGAKRTETGWADGVFLPHAGRKNFFDTLSPAVSRRGASLRYDLGQAAVVTITVGPSAPPMMPKLVASAPSDMLGLWLSSTAGAISVSVDESSLSVPNHPAGYSLYRS